jgi:hypothetical protein
MGIYYNDNKIYGIMLYHFIDDVENIFFQKISDTLFTTEMINEAKVCYEQLINNGLNNISIKIYTLYTTTYSSNSSDNNNSMIWVRATKDIFKLSN